MNQPGALAARQISPTRACRSGGEASGRDCKEVAHECDDGARLQTLARLYDDHAAVVLSLCRARLAGAGIDEADDACHETFLRAFRRLDDLVKPADGARDGASAQGAGERRWLYAIARHVCRERGRAHRRREHHEMMAHRNNGRLAQGVDQSSPSTRSADRSEMLERLSVALARLPERQRLALHLHYLDADPAQAAREALRLSRSGYYKLLSRARDLLVRHLSIPQRVEP